MKRLLALFLLVPGVACADTILTVSGSGPGASYGTSVMSGPINGNFYAGSYNGSTADGAFTNVQIYCVDIHDDINFGAQYTVNYSLLTSSSPLQGIVPPNTIMTAADNIAAVMGASYGGVGSIGFVANPNAAGNPDWNTGLQIALWSAEYNGLSPLNTIGSPLMFSPGSAGALADANAILNAASQNFLSAKTSGYAQTVFFSAIPGGYNEYNHRGQDMVAWLPLGQTVPGIVTPEPSSFALLGLGGIGLAFGAYRRRRATVV